MGGRGASLYSFGSFWRPQTEGAAARREPAPAPCAGIRSTAAKEPSAAAARCGPAALDLRRPMVRRVAQFAIVKPETVLGWHRRGGALMGLGDQIGGGRGDDDQFPSLPCSARAFPQHTDFLLRQRGCARNTWELSKTHEQAPSWACLPATWPATRCRSFSLANSKNLTCASQPSRRGGICYTTNTRLSPGTLVNGLLTATR
jgi:hypothetical protein